MNVLIGIGIYFAVGIIALVLLDWFTGRIRKRLATASSETQTKLAASGSYVGSKESVILVLSALWLFWPLAIVSALSGDNNG